ncbi:MAG: trypsin-like peptidase domain-containing protein [Lachnospiraceae bacterium]|nr:trypsin-like peptidase domain-containing protein [Lachnospiraceae bacterium]
MDNNFNNYDSYQFSTPIDPSPIDPTQEAFTTPNPAPKKPKKKGGMGKKFGTCIALALTFGLVSGLMFMGVTTVGNKLSGNNTQTESTSNTTPKVGTASTATTDESAEAQTTSTTATDSGEYTVAQVSANSMPAMVAITNVSVQQVQSMFGYGTQDYQSESAGSGIIVDQNDKELLIATNNHVVSGADTITVCFVDNQAVEGQIKGTDADNDLAIVAVQIADIPEETLNAIKVIQLGESDSLELGQQVVAIGNALGYGQSVTSGYVSALDREVTVDNVTSSLIQIDAAINPGNSGGALLNMKGELIGINAVKYAASGVEGMGYAIPISTASPILTNLMSQETRYKVADDQASYLGINCKNIASEYAEMYGTPVGIYVDSVVENGPSANAGIQKGDIITKIDGTSVTSYEELTGRLEYYAAGEKVDIVISRANGGKYEEQTVTVTLGNKSDSTADSSDDNSSSDSSSFSNGLQGFGR